jgi:hypothetical protein
VSNTPSQSSARVARWLGWLRRGLGLSMATLGVVVFWYLAAWNAERLASGPAVVLDTTWPTIAQGFIFLGVLLAGWPSSVGQRAALGPNAGWSVALRRSYSYLARRSWPALTYTSSPPSRCGYWEELLVHFCSQSG